MSPSTGLSGAGESRAARRGAALPEVQVATPRSLTDGGRAGDLTPEMLDDLDDLWMGFLISGRRLPFFLVKKTDMIQLTG